MCGIVGYVGDKPATPILIEGLKRLEYRGYDSAGIALLEGGVLERRRAEGKLSNLERLLDGQRFLATLGIGHTRWATHGAPTERNAHPHMAGGVALVHNGIIENFRELRTELEASGAVFETDTDSEAIAHLIARERAAGRSQAAAFAAALARLEGAFALAVLFEDDARTLHVARLGSPLAIGLGEDEVYVGSDAIALAPFTTRVIYLEDGDRAALSPGSIRVQDLEGREVVRPVTVVGLGAQMADKGNHRHFMAKEIFEQPEVIGHTLAAYIDPLTGRLRKGGRLPDFAGVEKIVMSACGTAYYAGLVARYWFERLARVTVEVDIASEFRYRAPVLGKGTLGIFISQSGETADTMAALRFTRSEGARTVAVVNATQSTIAREADTVCPILAGPEIGVASTKAFTCQLVVLACLAIAAGRARGTLSDAEEARSCAALLELPRHLAEILKADHAIHELAHEIAKAQDVLYLGRGVHYPLALEGALKLKEISYIHAEGYAAGELKHGPIALIDENVPVIVIAPHDALFDKTVSNMHEVIARKGRVLMISDAEGLARGGDEAFATIRVPTADPLIQPVLVAVPVQLLAYHTAVLKGTDVDQPRNLAKSVTVE
ncbi:MAG: glutamine--fructose-6-phosphate transaminase (isomerizing) [Alphaproteobacteria bacterium]|nr:glutamine--fructose-6-phosphate transaminase (isomerizing) [Alphaproteobacteria bacterium]